MLEDLLKKTVPKKFQNTMFVRLFGFLKVPLIFWVDPSVVKMRCILECYALELISPVV